MKDPAIESKVNELKVLVEQINTTMSDLQYMNVEVKIAYVDKNIDKNISQGVRLWKVEERNGYL